MPTQPGHFHIKITCADVIAISAQAPCRQLATRRPSPIVHLRLQTDIWTQVHLFVQQRDFWTRMSAVRSGKELKCASDVTRTSPVEPVECNRRRALLLAVTLHNCVLSTSPNLICSLCRLRPDLKYKHVSISPEQCIQIKRGLSRV